MVDLFAKPSEQDILESIQRCFPALGAAGVSYLAEGWDSWAYEAAGCIFRVPKHEYTVRSQEKERLLMPGLARRLPLPVPDMEFNCEAGPGGRPFVGYRRIPGIPLSDLPGFVAPALGAPLGAFLKALHTTPPADFAGIFDDETRRQDYGADALERIGGLYERVIRRVFPLISCEAREATRELFEAFLGNPENFAYKPCIVHGDLGAEHLLVDPSTGALTGVIDFGDAWLGDPAGDFASIFAGGIADALGAGGIDACIEGYGPEARRFESRARFYHSLGPYYGTLAGLSRKDDDILESGLKQLAELAIGRQPCP
jgi:aminoglycoside 2''-phosphotransferase